MALSKTDLSDIQTMLGRLPSKVEDSIFDTMWSEHCSYKSSKHVLKKYLPTKGKDVVVGVGEDSGIIHFATVGQKRYCIAVSHESHNHPSQILPVEGAATGVGGVVRDVYCMGADVVGVLNSLHFGVDPDNTNPLVEEIAEDVVKGVSDYANPLGVPVLGGETIYHDSYNDNCLVNVAAVGIVEEDRIIHSYTPENAKKEPYDVILFGKSTDATGFGGASFASADLDEADEATNLGAVQVHDPFLKRVLVEAMKVLFDDIKKHNVAVGLKDLGAGGIACATSEIASSGGFGIDVHLDKVNVGVENLPPEVIACSETQERFCIVVPRWFTSHVLDIFNVQFECHNIYHKAGAVVIGEIISEPLFSLFYHGEKHCELPISAITTEVSVDRVAKKPENLHELDQDPVSIIHPIDKLCLESLSTKTCCSKRFVYRFFDNAVRGDTISYPGETDAVVIAPIKQSQVGLTVSMDSNLYGVLDPYVSGTSAVAEGIRNVVAVGGVPLAITDCLNYGNPENPEVFHGFQEGVKGIADAAKQLNMLSPDPIPIVSGNVSFYNQTKQGQPIVPSPVIMVVGRVDNYHVTKTMNLKRPNTTLIVMGKRYAEFGQTVLSELEPGVNKVVPKNRFSDALAMNKMIHALIYDHQVRSVHDISQGGAWVAIAEMVLGERGTGEIGASLSLPEDIDPVEFLFSENEGYVIEVDSDLESTVLQKCKENNVMSYVIGSTMAIPKLTMSHKQTQVLSVDISTMKQYWDKENDST